MKKAICKYCGDEFEQSNKGRKKDYCNKEDCIRQARNEANRKWYAKKMKALKGTKNRIIEQKEEKKIVYSSTDRAINDMNNEDFSVVIELARELGTIRYRILEEIKKCSPEQSRYDKLDDVFLHEIENLVKKDVVYEDEIVNIVKKHLNNRPNRRFIKDKQEMLKHLVQGVIADPNQYVVQFIKNRDSRTYNNKIERSKSDETIRK